MRHFLTEQREQRIRQVLGRRQKDLTLVLDCIWDPHNVSAILRSCDAFGVGLVHLHYITEAFPDIGKKSSGSARKWVARRRHNDTGEMVAHLHDQGMQILAAGFDEQAKSLAEWDLTRPTAVVLGNEHGGISPELATQADGTIYIPMQGMIPSFNVSVAAAIILYEAYRQRNAKGMYDRPSLPPDELEALFEDWATR